MHNFSSKKRRLRVLTWHIHGSYLYYLTNSNADFFLPVGRAEEGYGGKTSNYHWGKNVVEVPFNEVKNLKVDLILFQSRKNYLEDQEILSDQQKKLPFIYLEHDPPRESPTETKHLVYDSKVLLVHVTNFNKLMWDSGTTKTKVIEHGVTVPSELKYWGTLRRGVVVINNLESRGRRLGADIFEEVRKQIPLDLLGINSERLGGLGDLPQKQMLGALSQYRFYFSPIRYTSLGLSICEAMMLGLPIVGLATTELPTVVKNGYSGFTSNNLGDLIREMKQLLLDEKLATNLGQGARQTAEKRFNLTRFAKNWEETFEEAVAREKVALEVAL